MITKFGLSSNTRTKIKTVFAKFNKITEAIVYGSRAKGTHREGSDIDISLKGEISFEELLQIERQLDDQMLPYTFDISIYSTLSSEDLIAHIDRCGKTIYTKMKKVVKDE